MIAALATVAAPAVAQLPPAADIPRFEEPLPPSSKRIFTTIDIPNRPTPTPVMIYVAPGGPNEGDGSAKHPFRSLLRAKAAVRTYNRDHDVTVQIADGIYRLEAPLRFNADDGGSDGFTVRWEGAEGAHPVISAERSSDRLAHRRRPAPHLVRQHSDRQRSTAAGCRLPSGAASSHRGSPQRIRIPRLGPGNHRSRLALSCQSTRPTSNGSGRDRLVHRSPRDG